ncbi:MAG: YCF48-related protein [Acidobacteriota bacterium]
MHAVRPRPVSLLLTGALAAGLAVGSRAGSVRSPTSPSLRGEPLIPVGAPESPERPGVQRRQPSPSAPTGLRERGRLRSTTRSSARRRGDASPWEIVKMKPSVFMYGLEIMDDGLTGFACGGRTLSRGESLSTFLRTRDGGLTWEERHLPDLTATGLNDLDFIDDSIGWVVGDKGHVYKTVDAGETWVQQVSGTTRDLSGVSFVDDKHGWACGDDGRGNFLVITTVDGGLHWHDRSFGSGGIGATDIKFVNETTGFIAVRDGSVAPHVYKTTDRGATWDETPLPPEMNGIQKLSFPSETVGFAVGYSNPNGTILRTTDAGTSWEIVGASGYYYNDALDCQSVDRCAVAAFDLGGPRSRLLTTEDGGDTWTTTAIPPTRYLTTLAHRDDKVWIGSNFSQVWHGTDRGEGMDFVHHAPLWWTIDWRSEQKGLAMTTDYVPGTDYTELTFDGGASWDYDPGTPGARVLRFLTADDAVSCHYGRSVPLWQTTNGGDSWDLQSTVPGWLEECHVFDASRVYLYGGDGLIRRSDDAGTTWSMPLTTGSVLLVNDIEMRDRDRGWAVTGAHGNGEILQTLDGGDTWLDRTPAEHDHYRSVTFLDDDFGFVTAVGGRIHRTTDGGDTWTLVAEIGHYDTEDLYIHDANRAWVAIRDNPTDPGRGHLYMTEDGGETWTLEWSSPWIVTPITALVPAPDRAELWAVGENATILRRPLP